VPRRRQPIEPFAEANLDAARSGAIDEQLREPARAALDAWKAVALTERREQEPEGAAEEAPRRDVRVERIPRSSRSASRSGRRRSTFAAPGSSASISADRTCGNGVASPRNSAGSIRSHRSIASGHDAPIVVSARSRDSTAVVPSSDGWASTSGPCLNGICTPSARNTGDAAASG
jgi:hypothetical protein